MKVFLKENVYKGTYKSVKYELYEHPEYLEGFDIDLTAWGNDGKIVDGGIDKYTFSPRSKNDVLEHLYNILKRNKSAQYVSASDRMTGRSLATMRNLQK